MKWFVAKVCYQIITATASGPAQFEEQMRLIKARGEAEALEKARYLGALEEEVFLNAQRQPVQWKWLGVTELEELADLEDGTELLSNIKETTAPHDYLTHVSQRSQLLENRLSPDQLECRYELALN
jgi:hypothetical protein